MDKRVKNPEDAVKLFFDSLCKEDRITAWNILSKKSQNEFIESLYFELKTNPQASHELKEYTKEQIRTFFENDTPGLIHGFWNSFTESSYAKTVSIYAKYQTTGVFKDYAVVDVNVKVPDLGRESTVQLKVVLEDHEWKLGIIESKLRM